MYCQHCKCLAVLCDFFGMVKWPFQWLSDLQLGDKKVTLNQLVSNIYCYVILSFNGRSLEAPPKLWHPTLYTIIRYKITDTPCVNHTKKHHISVPSLRNHPGPWWVTKPPSSWRDLKDDFIEWRLWDISSDLSDDSSCGMLPSLKLTVCTWNTGVGKWVSLF